MQVTISDIIDKVHEIIENGPTGGENSESTDIEDKDETVSEEQSPKELTPEELKGIYYTLKDRVLSL